MRYDPADDLAKYRPECDWSKYGAVKNLAGSWIWRNESGQYHNQNGPAYIGESGHLEWFINGFWHREDVPARVWPDGYCQYWIHGELVTEERYWHWYYMQQTIKFMTGTLDKI